MAKIMSGKPIQMEANAVAPSFSEMKEKRKSELEKIGKQQLAKLRQERIEPIRRISSGDASNAVKKIFIPSMEEWNQKQKAQANESKKKRSDAEQHQRTYRYSILSETETVSSLAVDRFRLQQKALTVESKKKKTEAKKMQASYRIDPILAKQIVTTLTQTKKQPVVEKTTEDDCALPEESIMVTQIVLNDSDTHANGEEFSEGVLPEVVLPEVISFHEDTKDPSENDFEDDYVEGHDIDKHDTKNQVLKVNSNKDTNVETGSIPLVSPESMEMNTVSIHSNESCNDDGFNSGEDDEGMSQNETFDESDKGIEKAHFRSSNHDHRENGARTLASNLYGPDNEVLLPEIKSCNSDIVDTGSIPLVSPESGADQSAFRMEMNTVSIHSNESCNDDGFNSGEDDEAMSQNETFDESDKGIEKAPFRPSNHDHQENAARPLTSNLYGPDNEVSLPEIKNCNLDIKAPFEGDSGEEKDPSQNEPPNHNERERVTGPRTPKKFDYTNQELLLEMDKSYSDVKSPFEGNGKNKFSPQLKDDKDTPAIEKKNSSLENYSYGENVSCSQTEDSVLESYVSDNEVLVPIIEKSDLDIKPSFEGNVGENKVFSQLENNKEPPAIEKEKSRPDNHFDGERVTYLQTEAPVLESCVSNNEVLGSEMDKIELDMKPPLNFDGNVGRNNFSPQLESNQEASAIEKKFSRSGNHSGGESETYLQTEDTVLGSFVSNNEVDKLDSDIKIPCEGVVGKNKFSLQLEDYKEAPAIKKTIFRSDNQSDGENVTCLLTEDTLLESGVSNNEVPGSEIDKLDADINFPHEGVIGKDNCFPIDKEELKNHDMTALEVIPPTQNSKYRVDVEFCFGLITRHQSKVCPAEVEHLMISLAIKGSKSVLQEKYDGIAWLDKYSPPYIKSVENDVFYTAPIDQPDAFRALVKANLSITLTRTGIAAEVKERIIFELRSALTGKYSISTRNA